MTKALVKLLTHLLLCVLSLSVSCLTHAQSDDIAYITMKFPEQIKWEQSTSQQFKNGNMLVEWLVRKTNLQTTPVRVVYNKVIAKGNANAFAKTIIQQSQRACVNVSVTRLPNVSQHKDQYNAEILCSRLGKLGFFGTATYLTVLSDAKSKHILLSEIKTIPSKKAGFLTPRNPIEEEQVKSSQSIIALMEKFNKTARACNAKKVCH